MILGVGIDVAEIGRFAGSPDPGGLLEQVLTREELGRVTMRGTDARAAALLFAVKEALVKAFGCGMSGGWRWREISVSEDFTVALSGRMKDLADERAVSRILVSHSSSADHAVALVLLEG